MEPIVNSSPPLKPIPLFHAVRSARSHQGYTLTLSSRDACEMLICRCQIYFAVSGFGIDLLEIYKGERQQKR